jgi:hypothetical protein
LLDGLIEMGYVTNEQLGSIRAEADATGEGVVDTLVAKNVLSPTLVAQAKATHFGAADAPLIKLVNRSSSRRSRCGPRTFTWSRCPRRFPRALPD